MKIKDMMAIANIKLPEELKKYEDIDASASGVPITTKEKYVLFVEDVKLLTEIYIEKIAANAYFSICEEQLFTKSGSKLPCIINNKPTVGYGLVCNHIRQDINAKIIAITGSVGKTTIKDMLYETIKDSFNSFKNDGNANGYGRIGRNIQRVKPECEVYIQEVGALVPPLVYLSSKMLEPNTFLVTNVFESHIEDYGSIEAIAEDKLSIDKNLKDDGVVFLNIDNELLAKAKLNHKVISFSMFNSEADYYASDIKLSFGKVRFIIHDGDEAIKCTLNISGKHNVNHALGVYAIGRWLGIEGKKLARGISNYRTDGIRQNLTNIGGYNFYIDCYNASLKSDIAALNTMDTIKLSKDGKKIAVLADIESLGEYTVPHHEALGKEFINHPSISEFVCVGPKMKYAADIADSQGIKVKHFMKREELNHYLRETVMADDIVLFKGSHSTKLMLTIDQVYGTSFFLGERTLLKEVSKTLDHDLYNLVDIQGLGVELVSPKVEIDSLFLDKPFEKMNLAYVGKSAFSNSNIKAARLANSIKNIGEKAFFKCTQLEEISWPKELMVIERSAFNGCIGLKSLRLPSKLTHIGIRAFLGCENLERVFISDSVKHIEENSFTKCPKLVIECYQGSYAEAFAKDNEIEYNIVKKTFLQRFK